MTGINYSESSRSNVASQQAEVNTQTWVKCISCMHFMKITQCWVGDQYQTILCSFTNCINAASPFVLVLR